MIAASSLKANGWRETLASNPHLGHPRSPLFVARSLHGAFDANLIGIDADYRVHVSEALMSMNDGPMLEHGIKAMASRIIRLPGRTADYPDRDRLAERFASFARAG